jgi:hypothetical protein
VGLSPGEVEGLGLMQTESVVKLHSLCKGHMASLCELGEGLEEPGATSF